MQHPDFPDPVSPPHAYDDQPDIFITTDRAKFATPGRPVICDDSSTSNSSGVHSQGNNVDYLKPLTLAQWLRFRHCEERRRLQLFAMRSIDSQSNAYMAARACGTQASFVRSKSTGEVKIVVNGCGQRTCPMCQKSVATELEYRLLRMLGTVRENEWSFITLTLRATDGTLRDQLDFLRASFRRLRQQHIWQENVFGGRAMIEVTFNQQTGSWHPHLHILTRANFIRKDLLSKAWARATLGSTIIDIQRIASGSQAAKYVSCYVGKAPDLSSYAGAVGLTVEYFLAIKDAKMVIPFGKLKKGEDPDDPANAPPDPDDWILIGNLEAVLHQAEHGDQPAIELITRFLGRNFTRPNPKVWSG